MAQVNDLNYGSLTKLELHCTVKLITVTRQSEERGKYIPAEKDICESFCRRFLRAADCRRTSRRIVNPNTLRTGWWLQQALLRHNCYLVFKPTCQQPTLFPGFFLVLQESQRENPGKESAREPVHRSTCPRQAYFVFHFVSTRARSQCIYTRS